MLKKAIVSFFLAIHILTQVAQGCGKNTVHTEQSQSDSRKDEANVVHFDSAVVRRMMLEDGYANDKDLEISINSLKKIDKKLQPLIDAYIKDRTISDAFTVEGLTVAMIMKKYDSSFWSALESLDNFIDNPEGAKLLKESPYSIKLRPRYV